MLPDEHEGFHFNCENRSHTKGLYKGKKNEDDEISCTLYVHGLDPSFYYLRKEDGRSPHMSFVLNGERMRIPIGNLGRVLKDSGYPLTPSQTRLLTTSMSQHVEYLSEMSREERTAIHDRLGLSRDQLSAPMLYDYLGYDIDGKIRVIDHKQTVQFHEIGPEINDNIADVREALLELLELSSDPKAVLITLAYAVMAPLAGAIKKRGKFFPNLALVGSPESGKSSLINLFCARGWGTDENIRTSQDFVTQFASLKNLEGNGLPLIVNDLKQEAFDKLRDLILSSVDGVRGGSRGMQRLDLMKYEISRSFVISSNWLQFGTQEIADRFIIMEVHGKRGNEQRWNQAADRLRGVTYMIARNFFSDKKDDSFADILEWFFASRNDVKSSIIRLGMEAIRLFLYPAYELPKMIMDIELEEYRQEDYFSMLLSWCQMEYEAMERKYGRWASDNSYERNIFVYEEQNYVKKNRVGDTENYIVFPLAFQKFLKEMGPTFPLKSISAFADRYSERAKVDSRKFKTNSGIRDSFRVLIISGVSETDDEPVPEEKEFATMQIEIRDVFSKRVPDYV
jgi:hypothetical protein